LPPRFAREATLARGGPTVTLQGIGLLGANLSSVLLRLHRALFPQGTLNVSMQELSASEWCRMVYFSCTTNLVNSLWQ
jgi:hypothetical protein